MPIIETSNIEVQAYKGIHLYHFWLSSCSQRVRIVLAEKNLEWVDHTVDISPQGLEHATDAYQSIHPLGLVPALVHDGQVIIESIDIIDYLDQTFPEPPLNAVSENGKREMHQWMGRANAAQHSIKTLTHEFLFKPNRMTSEQLKRFLEKHKNEELREFMKVFCSDEGFQKSIIESELRLQHDEFVALDEALEGHDWLVENTFTLADIAWIPNVRRLDIMMYPLDRHPNLLAWYERIKIRPGYINGMTDCEIQPALEHFAEYSKQRAGKGTGVSSFRPLANVA
jgi:glutathione S-transferase